MTLDLALSDLSLIPVGGYERISDDFRGKKRGREGEGVDRQREDNDTLASLHGMQVRDRYRDNDISAFKESVVRPEFERLVADLEARRIRGIVCYNLDRLARQPKDLERLIKIYDGARARGEHLYFASVQGDINLQSDDGITMARVMVAFANKSSRDTSRRVARTHLALAQAGRPVGGVRPFGFEGDRITHHRAEADLIRRGFSILLAGGTLAAITRLWNESSTTPFGKPWCTTTVRNVIKSPRLAGLRIYRGKLLLDEGGEPVRGTWEAIVDFETWTAVQDRLATRRTSNVVSVEMKYLLSGFVRCRCGQPMHARRDSRSNATTAIRQWAKASGHTVGERGRLNPEWRRGWMKAGSPGCENFYYFCRPKINGGQGCGSNAISGRKVDDLIEELVLRRLLDQVRVDSDLVWERDGELEEVKDQYDELWTAWRAREATGARVFSEMRLLETRMATLRSERSAWLRTQTTHKAQGLLTRERWAALSLAEKRAHIERSLISIVIQRAAGRGAPWLSERIVPIWRSPA